MRSDHSDFRAPPPACERLITKLETIADLSNQDREALRNLPLALKEFGANQVVVREGDSPARCCILIDGFMHRFKSLPDGSRQVLSYHLPGDFPDLMSLHLGAMDHSLGTVVKSQVGFVTHDAIRDIATRVPGVAFALWRNTLIDAATSREWIVNMGSRHAPAKIAHLLCELYVRLRSLGLADQDGFTLPLTQAEISAASGLSAVHVNRTLQGLRGAGLVTSSDGRYLKILDWHGLKEEAAFDPGYLHLKDC